MIVRWRTGPSSLLLKQEEKKVRQKKEKERKSQPYGLRFLTELHLHSNGGRTSAAWRGTPPPVLPASSVSRDHPQRSSSRERGEGADPGCRAPQLGCSIQPAQVSLLHSSLPGQPVMAFLDKMWNSMSVVCLLILKASVHSKMCLDF